MSKASYPYPDDEFDAPPDPDGTRGVHRAPRSAWRRWWPFLVVLVVVPALAYGAVTLATRNGMVPGFDPGAGSTAGASGDESETPADDGSGDTPSGDASTPAASATATSTPSAVALGTPITVTNGAGIAGIAATAQTKLTAAGFTAVSAATGSKGTLTASTVFYATEALKPTADKVASTLGLTAVTQSATKSGGAITVMLVTKLP